MTMTRDEFFDLLERWVPPCRGKTEMFYPPKDALKGEHRDTYGVIEYPAKRICATCPVKADCLEAGLWEKHGIWGGTSDRQRRRIRRERREQGLELPKFYSDNAAVLRSRRYRQKLEAEARAAQWDRPA